MQAPSLRWDDARVLLALLRARTLSGAGQLLRVNASTVSRRLAALERALGAHLFDRTPDGLLPTALAEDLEAHAEAMDRAAAGLVLAVEGREVTAEGLVRLTAAPAAMEFLVAPALPRLLAAHPGLRLALDASVAYADLARREADLALRVQRPTSGDLLVRKLGEGRSGIFASPAYAAALGRLRSLGQARWITWGDDLAHIPQARFVAEQVPAQAVVVRTSHPGTQLAAARAGLGAIFTDAAIARATGLVEVQLSPALRRLPLVTRGELWLVTHRALRGVPRVAAVWDFIVEEARRAGYSPEP